MVVSSLLIGDASGGDTDARKVVTVMTAAIACELAAQRCPAHDTS